jgi:hypothetical protein
MRRLPIVLAVVFAGSVVLLGAWRLAYFPYALTRADPYPTFMEDQFRGFHSYEDAKRSFSDFVGQDFPSWF